MKPATVWFPGSAQSLPLFKVYKDTVSKVGHSVFRNQSQNRLHPCHWIWRSLPRDSLVHAKGQAFGFLVCHEELCVAISSASGAAFSLNSLKPPTSTSHVRFMPWQDLCKLQAVVGHALLISAHGRQRHAEDKLVYWVLGQSEIEKPSRGTRPGTGGAADRLNIL